MPAAGIAFALSLVLAAALTPAVGFLARKSRLLDRASTSRNVHEKPVPRLGGVAVVLAFCTPLLGLLVFDGRVAKLFHADGHLALAIGLGGALVTMVGVYDDLFGAGAKLKLAVQLTAAVLMYALGVRIDEISLPFAPHLQLGFLGLPLTLLWITGVTNAMNLIDGLDGLAGSLALIATATVFALAVQAGNPVILLFTAALGGATLGFLFFNFHPASIFLGDTGSMFLGLVLAATSIQTRGEASGPAPLVVAVVVLGVPILDTLLAIARRAARGAPLFSADRGHIHHRLLALGLSQRQAVFLLCASGMVLGASALALATASGLQALTMLVGLALAAGLGLYLLGYLRPENVRKVLSDRRHNRRLREGVRQVAARLQRASRVTDVWESLKDAAPRLGARGVALRLVGARESLYHACEPDAGAGHVTIRRSLVGERREDGHIEFAWNAQQAPIGRDTEIAVELLCHNVKSAMERIDVAREGSAANAPPSPLHGRGSRDGRRRFRVAQGG